MEINLLPHTPFLKEMKEFNQEQAIQYCAQLAGVCYEPAGFQKLKEEDPKRTRRRLNATLKEEHATPYEHIQLGLEMRGIPKILAMILNNERQCVTSEQSLRYTKITPGIENNITTQEGVLYHKWMDIFKQKIEAEYGTIFKASQIEKLAQENSRYLISVFIRTKMIHTIPWIQLNRIVSYMNDLSNKPVKNDFEQRLTPYITAFISCLERLNVLDERAQSNRKQRSLSLFSSKPIKEVFGDVYATSYQGSFAQLAQAHRHRTLKYEMELLPEKAYYVPPIIKDDQDLVNTWEQDLKTVKYPQGELVKINEMGTYYDFILKAKERLCSHAQLEIMQQTKATLLKYKEALERSKHPLVNEIELYLKGARCTFPDYTCAKDCNFKAGKVLTRHI